MRTALPLSVAAATLMALSCSSGGPTICAGSEAIPQQTVTVGEDLRVAAVCFEDPADGDLTYSGVSADASIAEAFGRGTAIWIQGVSPGQTSVTATATNESDLSKSVEFQVLVPNQAPELVDSIGDVTLVPSIDIVVNLEMHFADPDEQELTYSVTSSSPTIVGASVTDSTLTLTLLAREGSSAITVTASDGDLTTTGTFDALSATLVIDEPFDSEASLDDWEIENASAEVENGALVLTATEDGLLGLAGRGFGGVAGEFFIILDVVEPDAGAQGGIQVRTADRTYMFLIGQFNADWNWLFVWTSASGWTLDDEWSAGSSDALTSFDEVEVSLSMVGGHARATVDGEVLFDRVDAAFFSDTNIDGIVWVTNISAADEMNLASRVSQIVVYATDFTEGDFDPHRDDAMDEHFEFVDIPFRTQ